VVAAGNGSEANGEGGVAMSMACSMLIMLNNFEINSLVDCVAPAYSHRPASMFWSCSMSIAIELTTSMTLEEVRQGVVGL
jgi:hypothetical protein